MFPDSVFARPVSSFNTPVPPPTSDPDAGPSVSVCVSTEWIAYIIGALKQLLLQTTWQTTDPDLLNQTQGRVFNLIDMFSSAPICSPLPAVTSGDCEGDCDCMACLRFENGVLQQLECGVWTDVPGQPSGGIVQPPQPGGNQPQPPSGGGQQCYSFQMDAHSTAYVPTVLNSGDIIQVQDGTGAVSNSHNNLWRCIDGNQFYGGRCESFTEQFSTDPVPTANNGSLVIDIGGVFYSLNSGPFVVPSGVSNQPGIIQVNDASINNLSGSFTFQVCVTNNVASTWTHLINFAVTGGGFVNDTTEPGPNGLWVGGTGWTPQDETDGTDHRRYIFIRLTLPSAANITAATLVYNLTKGTFTADDTAIDIQTASGHNSLPASGLVSGSGLSYAVSLSGTTTFVALRLESSFSAPAALWDGSCTMLQLELDGTGPEPVWP